MKKLKKMQGDATPVYQLLACSGVATDTTDIWLLRHTLSGLPNFLNRLRNRIRYYYT